MGRVFWGGARSDLRHRRRKNRLGRLSPRIRMIDRVGRLLVTMVVDLILRIEIGIVFV